MQPADDVQGVCLALPAYNEAACIEALLAEAVAALGPLGLAWSVVVVDDGSTDDTAARVEAFAALNPDVRLVRHPENRGLGGAILTCLQAGLEAPPGLPQPDPARHLVVCMDADLTHPPSTIPAMIDAARAGADLVIASRYRPGSQQIGVPPFRRLMSWGARRLFRHYLDIPGVRDYTCGFRGFRGSLIRQGLDHFGPDRLITRSGFACTDELLVHLAMLRPRITEVPFVLQYDRKLGASKMDLGVTIVETLRLLRGHRRKLREGRVD